MVDDVETIGNAPTVSVAKETNQVAATIKYANIVKMSSVLRARYMPKASWTSSPRRIAGIRNTD